MNERLQASEVKASGERVVSKDAEIREHLGLSQNSRSPPSIVGAPQRLRIAVPAMSPDNSRIGLCGERLISSATDRPSQVRSAQSRRLATSGPRYHRTGTHPRMRSSPPESPGDGSDCMTRSRAATRVR